MSDSFKERVYTVVKNIKSGHVMTYQQVAKEAGNAKAFRAVGVILASNKDRKIPCHRVVRSDGAVGGYNRINGNNKLELLKKEGVLVDDASRIIF